MAAFFTLGIAFLATDPPGRALVRLQLGSWNAGTLLVAVGVPAASQLATIAGAALLVVGLAAFVKALHGLRRRSLQRAPVPCALCDPACRGSER
jgi:hypothetical protein